MARNNQRCCIETAEKWYQSFLTDPSGQHSEVMTRAFLRTNRYLSPTFADILGAAEFRVAASKDIDQALMRPLVCLKCGTHVALVILGLPFMLLLFRLQVIYHSMVENWEYIPEGPNQFRECIKTRQPGDFQLHQLRLGLDMYLGAKDISLEGMHELLAALNQGSPESRLVFLEAVRVAESWVVAHEFFHACVSSEDREAFPQFAPFAESNQAALKAAAIFSEKVCVAQKLQPKVGQFWLEEFQADLLATKMLLIGIAEKHERNLKAQHCSSHDKLYWAARILLSGIAAVFDAIYWVDVHRASPSTPESLLSSSHPPHHIRWRLITQYVEAIVQKGDAVLHDTRLVTTLSARLADAHLTG